MKASLLFISTIIVLFSLFVLPVSAETVTGSLGSTGIESKIQYNPYYSEPDVTSTITYLLTSDIENTENPFSIVRFMNTSLDHFDHSPLPAAPASAYTSVTFRLNNIAGAVIGTGTIGYQRTFNNAVPPVETPNGFFYVLFDSWDTTGLTGDKVIYLDYDRSELYNASFEYIGQWKRDSMTSWIGFGGNSEHPYSDNYFYSSGQLVFNRYSAVYSEYTATRPSGLGISGNVVKTFNSRIFVTTASDVVLTSDTTSNPDTFYFTIPDQQIKIKMLSPSGTWYNSSLLFAPITPTTTTTTTPAPGSWSNITFTTKYANETPISNVFVKVKMYYEGVTIGEDNWQQAIDGYTDSNGQITFQQVDIDGWDFAADFIKPGLYFYGIVFDPTPYTYEAPIYLYPIPPGSGVPGEPTRINVTVQVKSASNYQPISGAWVTIGDSVSGTSYVGQATNATGYVYFPSVPNTANINGQITKSGYDPLTYWVTSGNLLMGDESVVKYLYLSSVTVTPTITPVPQNAVTLTPSPNSVDPGQEVSFTTTCQNATACTGAGGLDIVTYYEKLPDPSWDTRVFAIYHYNTTSSGWDYRPNSASLWQVGSFNPLTGAKAYPTISGTYTYLVNLIRTDYYSIGQAQAGVLVSGAVSGNLNMRLSAQDQTTGGHLSNYQMNLTNTNTGALTEWGTVAYDKIVLLPRGQDYTVRCSKEGYIEGYSDFLVPMSPDIEDGDMGTFVHCPLYPTGSISAGNTTVTVKVFDYENYLPLSGVQVQMSAPVIYSDSPKYTGGDGSGVFFILGQNQPYTVTASKTGYCAVTETGNTATLDTKNVYLNLKYGSCMGPTPTHTPTPGPTGTGTVIVTPTTFQPGNATSFWTPWINVFTMMGARSGEINYLLAGLIIILLMGAGAGMAGVLGAEVCMGFGAIFCVSIGLIPIWVVLAIIILGFLFYGLKIGSR